MLGLQDIKSVSNIFIYGAGNFGEILWRFLNRHDIPIKCFCQTDAVPKGTLKCGIDVFSFDDLLKQGVARGDIFLIAVRDPAVSSQIKLKLTNLFFDRVVIYECVDFIMRNLQNDTLNRYCLMCNSFIENFEPCGVSEKLFTEHHIIGGGHRSNAVCPSCRSIDRERWCFFVLSRYTNIFLEECRVLHFAPERGLSWRIKNNAECDYYSVDIVPGKAMHTVDITNIPFVGSTFDYIILNHVLEHITNEAQAISELKRVLKPDGKLVISFPICTDQKTIEDKGITTKRERLKVYGQEDHVRLYGSDFVERLEKLGLKINVYTPKSELTDEEIMKYGLIYDDVVMLGSIDRVY